MKCTYKTKEQLLDELRSMRTKVREVEQCRQEFRKAREKYERLLDSAPDAMVFVNGESRIVMTNAQFEYLFGYSNDEVMGKHLEILIPERFREKHHMFVSEFLKNPRVRPMGSGFEVYAVKKGGEEFPADISLSLLQTEEELLVSAAVRDITRRKEMEYQVEMNFIIQRVLNSMLKISLEPVSLEQQFGKILDLILGVPHLALQSKGAIYLIEDNPEVLIMKAQQGFGESEIAPCKEIPLGTCLCGKAASLSEIVYSNHLNNHHEIHHQGHFPHGHYCVPVRSGDQVLGLINVFLKEGHKRKGSEEAFLSSVASTLAGIIIHDRTEREKDRLQAQLALSEKLAALGRFTANVAHEIRNPLTAVGGFARRLDRSIEEGTKEKEYASYIISEVSRLEGILRNVLTFSRESVPRMEEQDINQIIDRLLKMKSDLCREKSISVQTSYTPMPPVPLDSAQLHEAVENLILNAIDAMPRGGVLKILTETEIRKDRTYACVRVQDSGKGIPEDILPMIFEPFYTTKVAENGTGLGLSIIKKIVEDHGGFTGVESHPGEGSSFTLCFPYESEKQKKERRS